MTQYVVALTQELDGTPAVQLAGQMPVSCPAWRHGDARELMYFAIAERLEALANTVEEGTHALANELIELTAELERRRKEARSA